MTPTLQTDHTRTRRLSGAGLRTFFRIGEKWHLTRGEQMSLLGLTAPATYQNWKTRPGETRLGPDTLDRVSFILGIYKALQILLPGRDSEWIKNPNDAIPFGGHSPLKHMVRGDMQSVWEVRQYLDAQRGA